MIKSFDILLDTKKEIINRIHNLNSNDFNVLKFFVTVNENGVPKDLTGATSAKIAIRKPDGKAVFVDGTITELTKGKITFSLSSQAVIASGNHTAEVMIYKKLEEVLVTTPFVYHVNKGVLSDETLKSTNEYPAILKALQAGELLRDHDLTTLQKVAAIIDSINGAGLQYRWDGTRLGVKRETDDAFSYVDLRGSTGATGATGPKGETGITLYTWIKYATSAAGAGMSDSPTGMTYIGIATNKTTATKSTTPGDYTWSLFKGDKGDKGDSGDAFLATSFEVVNGELIVSYVQGEIEFRLNAKGELEVVVL